MKHSARLFGFLFFFCVNCFVVKAQQSHFIYVQSEDKQPFAIVLNGKVFSASDYGYVIIPKLADTVYNFTVSFPLNKFPDQAFTYTVNKKDAGFFLKNSADGWALQNMQTQKMIMNNNAQVAQKNAFGDMLSEVVSDSTLNKKNVTAEQPATTAAVVTAGAVVASTALINSDTLAKAGAVTDSAMQPEKISESKLDTGTNMLFVDKSQSGNDTINVFIPSETTNTDLTTNQQSSSTGNTTTNLQTETVPVIVPAVSSSAQNNVPTTTENVTGNDINAQKDATTSNPFYSPEKKDSIADSTEVQSTQTASADVTNAVKQDCVNMISDAELDKLKRKMFTQKSDNDMVQYAVKSLNKKCITTDQVKLLGSLFSSDDGRYNLYDALYNYVYDYGNYPGLASQILDPYYKKRFAALLR